MLSLHAREVALEKKKTLADERQETCNIFAHDFRNIMARIAFVYRAINNEISYLREYWEDLIHQYNPDQPNKKKIILELNQLLRTVQKNNGSGEIKRLLRYQEQLMETCLLPKQNETWLRRKIKPLWLSIISKIDLDVTLKNQIEDNLESFEESIYVGMNQTLIDNVDGIPESLSKVV